MHYANCRKPTNIVKYCMIPFISHSEKGKTIRMEKRSVVARYRGRGWFDYKMLQQGNFFFGMMEVFYIFIMVLIIQL